MSNASVICLEDHRLSRQRAATTTRESPVAAAIAAPDPAPAPAPTVSRDFGAAVPADAEADARRASWHYPPATPIVDWFPPARTIESRVDMAIEGVRLFAIAGVAAIVAGTLLAAVAGAFAVVTGG